MSKWISFSLNSKMIGGALPADFAVPNQRSCGAWGDIPRLRSEQASRKNGVLIHGKGHGFFAAGIRSYDHAWTEKSFRNWTPTF